MANKTLVLAYSGGLDTSYCLKKLSQEGFDIHAVSVNTGGFSSDEIKTMEAKALKMGAFSYKSIDALKSFYSKVVKYLVFGNVLKNGTYPLSVSAERIVQALEIIAYAKEIKADTFEPYAKDWKPNYNKSVDIPTEIYFSASFPLNPGACPSTGLLKCFAQAIFFKTSSSSNKTPG